MTWKVIRAFRRPLRNVPLFWYTVTGDWSAPASYDFGSGGRGIAWLIIAGLLYVSMCGRGTVNIWLITAFSVLAGTGHGVIAAYQVSGKIAQAKAGRVYDFLCLTPTGEWGVNWALCAGCLHRYGALRATFILVTAAMVFTSLHCLSIVVKSRALMTGTEAGILMLLCITVIPTLLITDYAQSLVVASLVGILAPAQVSNRNDSRLWAVALFLMLQIGIYASWLLLATLGAEVANASYGGGMILIIVAAAILAVVRELAIGTLLSRLARRFDNDTTELDSTIGALT